MKISELQKRYDNGKAAIKTLEDAMPSEEECTKDIYLTRDGKTVEDRFGYAIKLASVIYRPDLSICINKEEHSFIRIYDSKGNNSCRDSINISVEAIKPLIEILKELI